MVLAMDLFLDLLSMLGESKLLVPACLLGALFVSRQARPSVWRWLAALGAAGCLVLITKLAFLGWGLGSAWLNFTGISGHAMVACAIYPVLGFAVGRRHSLGLALALAVAGTALSIAIGVSRVEIDAHSSSEVVAGLLLGALVSAWTVFRWPAARLGMHGMAAVLGFLVSWWAGDAVAPQVRTHNIVVALALELSGHREPYTREWLHDRVREPRSSATNGSVGAAGGSQALPIEG